jgi:hypothetical protein
MESGSGPNSDHDPPRVDEGGTSVAFSVRQATTIRQRFARSPLRRTAAHPDFRLYGGPRRTRIFALPRLPRSGAPSAEQGFQSLKKLEQTSNVG